jgi:hypothetical protein
VFHNRVAELVVTRQAGLDAAYAAHQKGFVHGHPQAQRPAAVLAINPLDPHTPLISASEFLEDSAFHVSPRAITT